MIQRRTFEWLNHGVKKKHWFEFHWKLNNNNNEKCNVISTIQLGLFSSVNGTCWYSLFFSHQIGSRPLKHYFFFHPLAWDHVSKLRRINVKWVCVCRAYSMLSLLYFSSVYLFTCSSTLGQNRNLGIYANERGENWKVKYVSLCWIALDIDVSWFVFLLLFFSLLLVSCSIRFALLFSNAWKDNFHFFLTFPFNTIQAIAPYTQLNQLNC